MNKPIVARHNKARSAKTTLLWLFCTTAVAVAFASGVFVSISHETGEPQFNRPLPAGQLQADARTVLAALDFLFHPYPTLPAPSATLGCDPGSFAFQSVTTSSMQGCMSNQADLPIESLTNSPARS